MAGTVGRVGDCKQPACHRMHVNLFTQRQATIVATRHNSVQALRILGGGEADRRPAGALPRSWRRGRVALTRICGFDSSTASAYRLPLAGRRPRACLRCRQGTSMQDVQPWVARTGRQLSGRGRPRRSRQCRNKGSGGILECTLTFFPERFRLTKPACSGGWTACLWAGDARIRSIGHTSAYARSVALITRFAAVRNFDGRGFAPQGNDAHRSPCRGGLGFDGGVPGSQCGKDVGVERPDARWVRFRRPVGPPPAFAETGAGHVPSPGALASVTRHVRRAGAAAAGDGRERIGPGGRSGRRRPPCPRRVHASAPSERMRRRRRGRPASGACESKSPPRPRASARRRLSADSPPAARVRR